ncbi:MAG: DUF3465 domain-containing protein [Candidatus Thiodiazotropha sp. (ex Monitilora ramsayi)]|nr:DUF3465 domain-containing protein [Candidatus Thiodiazotropha sp. (ex Monitilora ramsayi)]
MGLYFGLFNEKDPRETPSREGQLQSANDKSLLEKAIREKISDLQVMVAGRVIRVLPDDRQGSRHQRFIIRISSGETLLVAHNIDLAPRVKGIAVNDEVEIFGEYEWNEKGGVIHWTHEDPQGRHPDGWVQHKGQRYQ